LQRTSVCNIKKTKILQPKYRWGYPVRDARFDAHVR
jgi:hypothetical protein